MPDCTDYLPTKKDEAYRMKGIILYLFLIVTFSLPGKCQNMDSLYHEIQSESNELRRVDRLNDLAYQIRHNFPDEALKIVEEALTLSEDQQYYQGVITAYKTLGLVKTYGKAREDALEYYLKGLELAQEHQFKKLSADLLNNIGNFYFLGQNHDKALQYYSDALEIRRSLGDKRGMASTLGNMGNIARSKLRDQALAKEYYEESLQLATETGNDEVISIALSNLGSIHRVEGSLSKALDFYRRALALDASRNDLYGMSFAYSNICNLYVGENQFDSALHYCRLLELAADSLKSSRRKRSVYGRYSSIYKSMGNYQAAYEYQRKYQSLNDSILNESSNRRINELEAQYRSKLSEQENQALRQQNEVNEARLRNVTNERLIAVLTIVILIGAMRLLWLQLVKKKQQTKRLSAQKRELIEKSKEIEKINTKMQSQNNELALAFEELKLTQEQLIESEKIASITILTSGLAHELNNPLNYVSGVIKPIQMDLAELSAMKDLQKDPKTNFILEEMNSLTKNLTDGVEKVRRIVSNLMDISPESLPDQMRAIELDKILEASIFVISKNNPRIQINFDTDRNVVVRADYAELSQVFLNILKNSCDALSEQLTPVINISVDKSNNAATVSIADNGVGMNEKSVKKVFEPFFTLKEPGKGSGLGLYISQRIIKKYQGEIKVESREHEGTAITVEIPLEDQMVVFK